MFFGINIQYDKLTGIYTITCDEINSFIVGSDLDVLKARMNELIDAYKPTFQKACGSHVQTLPFIPEQETALPSIHKPTVCWTCGVDLKDELNYESMTTECPACKHINLPYWKNL